MRRFILAACTLVLLTSCGTDGQPLGTEPTESTRSTDTTTEPAETNEASPSPSATPTATSAPDEFALGQPFTAPTGSTATAHQVVRPAAPNAPAPEAANTEWAAIEVEVCAGTVPAGAFVSGQFWHLRDANNGQYDRSSVGYLQFPEPQFPMQQPVSGGECFRGWIVFSVSIGVPLTAISCTPSSLQPPFPSWPVTA